MENSLATQRWMRNPVLPASILLASILLSTPSVAAETNATSDQKTFSFQDTTWLATEGVQLTIEDYRGHKSLKIQTDTESFAQVAEVDFSTGCIEFDLAFAGRIAPRFCFGVTGEPQAPADMLMLHPWPRRDSDGSLRLYRAVLTKRERNFLVITYRQSSEEFDANRWVRVRIKVTEKRCGIFIDHDPTPAIELDNPFASGRIGMQGNCFIRNLRIDDASPASNEAAQDSRSPKVEGTNFIESNCGV